MPTTTNSLDKFKLHYEQYNETKTDLTHIRNHTRDLWVRACDALSDIRRKIFRLGRRAGCTAIGGSRTAGKH